MEWEQIRKQPEERFGAGLPNYEEYVSAFSWSRREHSSMVCPAAGSTSHTRRSTGTCGRGAATARPALDRARRSHPRLQLFRAGRGNQPLCQRPGPTRVAKGDRVFSLLGRIPELYFAALGTLKNGSVFSPLFSAFGPEPIKPACDRRCQGPGHIRSVLPPQDRALAQRAPSLEHVFLTNSSPTPPPGTTGLQPRWQRPRTVRDRADRARRHGAAALHQRHHRHARRAPCTSTRRSSPTTPPAASRSTCTPDDVFWCTADPGWVTGTSYGIIAPLTHGVTMIVDEADFDAERWYRILQDQQVTRLVHRADGDPDADAGRRRARRSSSTFRAALHRQRRRAAQPRGRGLGAARRSACRSTTTGGRPRPAAS